LRCSSSSCHWFPVWCLRSDSFLGCLGSHDFWALWGSRLCRWHAKATWHVDSCCCSCCYHSETCYIYVNAFAHVKIEGEGERVWGENTFIMPCHKFWNQQPYVTLTHIHPAVSLHFWLTAILTYTPFFWVPPPKSLDLAIKLLFSVRRWPASNCFPNTCTLFIYSFFPTFVLYFSFVSAYLSTLWLWLLLVTVKVGRKVEVNNSFRMYRINMQVMRRVRRQTIDGLTLAWWGLSGVY